MDFSSDDWTVTPLDGQDKSDIHFANWENINTEYQDTTPDNPLVFTGTDSRLGFGETESADHNVHIDLIGIAGIYGDYEEGNNLAVTPEKSCTVSLWRAERKTAPMPMRKSELDSTKAN